jgi:hypothetical protein
VGGVLRCERRAAAVRARVFGLRGVRRRMTKYASVRVVALAWREPSPGAPASGPYATSSIVLREMTVDPDTMRRQLSGSLAPTVSGHCFRTWKRPLRSAEHVARRTARAVEPPPQVSLGHRRRKRRIEPEVVRRARAEGRLGGLRSSPSAGNHRQRGG